MPEEPADPVAEDEEPPVLMLTSGGEEDEEVPPGRGSDGAGMDTVTGGSDGNTGT